MNVAPPVIKNHFSIDSNDKYDFRMLVLQLLEEKKSRMPLQGINDEIVFINRMYNYLIIEGELTPLEAWFKASMDFIQDKEKQLGRTRVQNYLRRNIYPLINEPMDEEDLLKRLQNISTFVEP